MADRHVMFYSCFDDLVEKTQRGDYDYAGCSGRTWVLLPGEEARVRIA
jgi:hypothetical protein